MQTFFYMLEVCLCVSWERMCAYFQRLDGLNQFPEEATMKPFWCPRKECVSCCLSTVRQSQASSCVWWCECLGWTVGWLGGLIMVKLPKEPMCCCDCSWTSCFFCSLLWIKVAPECLKYVLWGFWNISCLHVYSGI